MKKILTIVLCTMLMFINASCQSTSDNKTTEGALIGGLLGATAGGVIGHQSGHGLEGAGIGAAAGALTGALVGSQMKKAPQDTASGQGVNPNQMTMQQVVDLSKQGVNENVIIDKIRLTNSKFNLSAEDLTYLRDEGVSQSVINAMQGM